MTYNVGYVVQRDWHTVSMNSYSGTTHGVPTVCVFKSRNKHLLTATRPDVALSDIVAVPVPATVSVMILTDLSEINITRLNKGIVLAGLTAAKRMIVI